MPKVRKQENEVTGKPRHKKKPNKPYTIQYKYTGDFKGMFERYDGNWHFDRRFAKQKDRDQLLRKLQRDFLSDWFLYRAFDEGEE